MSEPEVLFATYDGSGITSNQPRALATGIDGYDDDAILTANIDELVDYFVERYRIDVPKPLAPRAPVPRYARRRRAAALRMRATVS